MVVVGLLAQHVARASPGPVQGLDGALDVGGESWSAHDCNLGGRTYARRRHFEAVWAGLEAAGAGDAATVSFFGGPIRTSQLTAAAPRKATTNISTVLPTPGRADGNA